MSIKLVLEVSQAIKRMNINKEIIGLVVQLNEIIFGYGDNLAENVFRMMDTHIPQWVCKSVATGGINLDRPN